MAKRHNNQDRVVAPESDARLAAIAQACARSGLPEKLCDILAEGYVFRLRRRVWSQLDDRIGTGDDVEALVGWQGPPRVLAKALERAGYLKDDKGILIAQDAITEAPEYIKARWRRHSKADYDAAAKRADRPNVLNPREAGPDEDNTDTDWEDDAMPEETLFGPVPDVPGENAHGESQHAKFVRRWTERYQQVEGRAYPFRRSDARWVQWIIDALPSWSECQRVIETYLADTYVKYRGHELRTLYTDLARFVAAGKPQRGASSGSQARTGSFTVRVEGIRAEEAGPGGSPAPTDRA